METKEKLIKSKKRVKDFAEVYTPNWLVNNNKKGAHPFRVCSFVFKAEY